MRGDDEDRLRHMLDAAEDARSFVIGREREDLEKDRMLALALVRSIEIIGEAGARVSAEGRAEAPRIPWTEIVAMRNRLIHGYYDVNLDIVWSTIQSDLPPLISTLESVLKDRETDQGLPTACGSAMTPRILTLRTSASKIRSRW